MNEVRSGALRIAPHRRRSTHVTRGQIVGLVAAELVAAELKG
ncbi:hypothetical protein ACFS5L_28625 [Streptomyces phyllanthi]|nr:hypothetical protein [Streptomyces phyllanthi]